MREGHRVARQPATRSLCRLYLGPARRDRTRTWLYQRAAGAERLLLSNDAILDVNAIFAGVFDLPGD